MVSALSEAPSGEDCDEVLAAADAYPAILRAVRAAIPDDGRLFLVEAIIPDDDSPHLAKDLDIRVMTILPGGERTESEYARLLTAAGFRPEPTVGLGPIESVMVGIPAGNGIN